MVTLIGFTHSKVKRAIKSACIVFVIFNSAAFAQNIELKPILINKGKVFYNPDVINSGELSNIVYSSEEETLNYFSDADVKKRSSFGIQQDLSIRGSTFEDNEINVDGVRINDPQTGHFSLELPFTEYDITSVSISPNLQKVNFSIKEPEGKGIFVKHSWGEYALYEDSTSLNFKAAGADNRISYEHKISSGARPNTDFKIHNLSLDSLWRKGNSRVNFIFGMTQRDFGADSFYSSLYPREEEHTRQRLFILKLNNKWDKLSLNNIISMRYHNDRYILDRHNPDLYTNHSTSYVYGYSSRAKFKGFSLGFNLGKDKITSASLGSHIRYKEGFSVGFKRRINKTRVEGSYNETHYDKFGWLEKWILNPSYSLSSNFIISFAYSHIWRVPSFTELYYESPANKGDDKLGAERSTNYEIGFKYIPSRSVNSYFGVFTRRQAHTIDWGRNTRASQWKALNIGRLKARGIDYSLRINLNKYFFKYLSLKYTYLTLDKKSPYRFSKYALDYSRHKITANVNMKAGGLIMNYSANFNHPVDRDDYCIFNISVIKKINSNTRVFIKGENIFNTSYYALNDIRGDKRWYKLGVSLNF